MRITLRKADALQKLITSIIQEIKLETTVAISRFEAPTTVVEEANKTFLENFEKKRDLTATLYALRIMIGEANAASGVTSVLGRMAANDKMLPQIKEICAAPVRPSDDILVEQIRDLREDKVAPQYGHRRESITVGILTKAQIEQFEAGAEAHRKERMVNSDKLLELNVNTEIELQPEMEKLLVKYGIL